MNTQSSTQKPTPRSFSGWALEAVIRLDADAPGTLRKVMSASPLRRQAIFLSLCLIEQDPALKVRLLALADPIGWATNPDGEVAWVLTTRRVRDVLHALFGPVEGLIGALGRLGDAPHARSVYRHLLDLLRRPDLTERANVLRQLETISSKTIAALYDIDGAFLHPEVIRRIDGEVRDFNGLVALIRRLVPDATDDELVSSLKATGSGWRIVSTWAERWLANKAVFEITPPLPDDDELVALRSGEAMRDAAKRFSNCLASKIPLVATGRAIYLEYRPHPAIIELAALAEGSQPRWAVEEIYAPKNGWVTASLITQVLGKLEGSGVLLPARYSLALAQNGAARILGVHDHAFFDLHHLQDQNADEDDDGDELACREAA